MERRVRGTAAGPPTGTRGRCRPTAGSPVTAPSGPRPRPPFDAINLFWYTNQYYAVTSPRNWQTRIAAFRLPGCNA